MTEDVSITIQNHAMRDAYHIPDYVADEAAEEIVRMFPDCSNCDTIGERDAMRAGMAIAVDLLEELQHAWEVGQGYHQEEDPQRCPDPVCDGPIGPNPDLDVEHADGCRYVELRKLAGMEW